MAETHADIRTARVHTQSLSDAGKPAEALKYAQEVEGHPYDTEQLLAITEIEAGEQLGDREIVARGLSRLEALEAVLEGPMFAYNKANGFLALWDLAVKELGIATALAQNRADLQRARDLYAAVGADGDVDPATRCQALVNLGNSLDSAGRYVDAIRAYDSALAIDPDFAMAHGNRGHAFMHRASVDKTHQQALGCEAVASLDAALARPAAVLAYGGPNALASFQRQRALIDGTPTHHHDHDPLPDPHLSWCLAHELFLHSSHPCISAETKVLDSLSLSGMVTGIDDAAQQRMRTLQDATNALLRDYIAARYLAWMCLEPDAPTREHAARLSQTASFYDTLTHGRWGVGTGLSVAALAAATNLLDKTANVTHLYLGTGCNPSHIYFRGFYLRPPKKGRPAEPDAVIAGEVDATNLGLLALCDLAGELERPTPLNELVARRHAATHRAIAVHHMLIEDIDDDGWLDRIESSELHDVLMEQLGRARAALLYFADLVNYRERRNRPDGPVFTMPSWPAEPERADDW